MTDPSRSTPPSDRARLRRAHERARYDRASLNALLDAQPLAHIACLRDGAPALIPTLQWREGDHLYFHGSAASRFLRAAAGSAICVSVSLLDGFVLARSAMHHSVNYRGAILYGVAEPVTQDKEARLRAMVERWFPGRWETLRPVTEQEIKATAILRIGLEEASVKLRDGPPNDDEADYALPIWAGVVPVRTVLDPPAPDPRCDQPEPAHLARMAMF